MNPAVIILDALAVLAVLSALAMVLLRRKSKWDLDILILITGLLSFMLLYFTTLLLEWSGLVDSLDAFEDIIGAVVPLWWAFVLYGLIQKVIRGDLRKSQEDYRTTLDGVPDAVIITTLEEGRYLYVNDTFTQLTGYEKEDILGKTTVEKGFYRHPDKRELVVQTLRKTGRINNLEIQGFDSGGRPLALLFSARRIKYQNQDCLVGVNKDLTELRKSEEERERLEDQLRQAQKMEALGTLAGGVAHDFNNILQVIGGYNQLLTGAKDISGTNRKYLEKMDRAAQRAASLVSQLLTFSRRVKLNLQPLDLNQEIEQAAEMLERMIPKMITIKTDLDPELSPIQGDSIQLEQVILNLGSNATDAMPSGGLLTFITKNVVFSSESKAGQVGVAPGKYVQLSVTDTGCGMDEEMVRHVFDPFFTTKKTGRGTGLGLATSYGIIASHRGRIVCSSRPGIGTTFQIYLPTSASSGKRANVSAASQEKAPGGHETILIADDEKGILEIAGAILTRSGYKVITALDGETALEIFNDKAEEIDLAILDLNMPGMGGHQCMAEMLKKNPKTKIIISSGYAAENQIRESKKLGAAGFVGKPYRFGEFLQTVRDVADMKQ